MWFRRGGERGLESSSAQQAKMEAEQMLEDVRAQAPEVTEISNSLRALKHDNGLAEAIMESMTAKKHHRRRLRHI